MRTDPASIEARALAALDDVVGDLPAVGLAVSGGGDSVALMHLAARWAQARGRRLEVASVDHGLRPAAVQEVEFVARAAAALGLSHRGLRWDGGGAGNLMDRARRARLRLLADWARDARLPAVMLGHTMDDQAETLLMRLSRGAGIDGLSAMAARRQDGDMLWLRPLLDFRRDDLRAWLRHIGAAWTEDPTNDDPRFQRVRIRQAMAQLDLDPAALALSARNLAGARTALNDAALSLAEGGIARHASLLLPRDAFDAAPAELRRRLILAALRFVSGSGYPPRRDSVEAVLQSLADEQRVTLDGAVFDPGDLLLIHREPAAAARSESAKLWDNRWYINGLLSGDRVRALLEDVAQFDWRAAGLRHLEARALPAVQRGARLFCPVLAPEAGLSARPIRDMVEFRQILLGH